MNGKKLACGARRSRNEEIETEVSERAKKVNRAKEVRAAKRAKRVKKSGRE